MRSLLSVVLAAGLPALLQAETAANLESLLAKAQEAQARSDYRTAAGAYREAVSIRPDLAELWSNLGLMQYEAHDYSRAEEPFRRALGIKKSLFVPNLFLGLDLLELKRPRQAVSYLLAAQELSPDDAQALAALGRAFHALRNPARSRDWYQRAADVAPRNGDAWYGLGIAYFDLAESASAKLTTAFAQSPYVAELKKQARADETRTGEHDEAVAFVPAMSSQPSLPALGNMSEKDLEHLAAGAFSSGDFRSAALVSERVQQRNPNQAAGWYWAVRAYQKLGVAALTRAGDIEPGSPKMHALLGDAYQRRHKFAEAEQEYSKMLALQPESIAGLVGLAGAYLANEQLTLARQTAQKALARDPADGDTNLLMAEILVAEHKYVEAEPYLDRSLHVRPELLPRVHALRGRIFAKTGRPKQAIDELTQGLASDEDGSLYYQLGRLYQGSGDANAAAAAFKQSERIRATHNAASEQTLSHIQ